MSPQNLPDIAPPADRRYDLDWLRVIAFGFLIFYHIGMFYVTWDWHVKSPYAGRLLEPVMGLINPWRLPLLFLISGVALRFAMDKARLGRFLPQRLGRLFIPIVFGMSIWIAPQAYFELLAKGETGPDFWQFWLSYVDPDQEFSIITPTYNHLWYLVYILIYTLLIGMLSPLLYRLAGTTEQVFEWMAGSAGSWLVLAVPAGLLTLLALLLTGAFPVTHALVDDWYNHAQSFALLLLGWSIAKSGAFWRGVETALCISAVLALTAGVSLLLARLLGMRGGPLNDLLEGAYCWAAIVTFLGLAQRHLNRPSAALRFLTEAVFPYYVLHQTIIVVVGALLGGLLLPVWLEAGLLVIATVGGCVLLTEAIKRVPLVRPLFGLPMRIAPKLHHAAGAAGGLGRG